MKKIISLLVLISMIFSTSMTCFANNSNSGSVKVYSFDLDSSSRNSISQENEMNSTIQELGLEKMLQDASQRDGKGKTLVSRKIYIYDEINMKPDYQLFTTLSRGDAICTGGKTIKVKDHYIHPEVDLLDDRGSWESALDTYVNIGLGFTSPWVWVPASLIDFSPISGGMDFLKGRDPGRDDRLMCTVSEEITYKIGMAEDVNNRFPAEDGYYPFAIAKKSDVIVQLTLTASDKNHRIKTAYGEGKKRGVKTPHYDDDDFLIQKAIDVYNGDSNLEYIENFSVVVNY